jgi:pyruvate/2-oxoglutarate dehydrogenase complex dihydrolipoamide dehydrogenase (E3) component
VDEDRNPVVGTEEFIPCDTLLLSIGLIPENELSNLCGIRLDPRTKGPIVNQNRETSVPGIFACGNVLHVHDLVDYVSEEAEIAALGAVAFIQGPASDAAWADTASGEGITYVVPQRVDVFTEKKSCKMYMRVDQVYSDAMLQAVMDGEVLASKTFERLLPGEMASLQLPVEKLKNAAGKIVTFQVKRSE